MDRNSNTYYYHYDGNGSVTEVTDASGNIQESYTYSPYGQSLIFDDLGAPLTSSNIENPYMFTGRRWDDETGIYYYRARMYDPAIGRFLQRDPVGYADSMNLYSYAGNSPVNASDPLGSRIKWNWTGAWRSIRNNAGAFLVAAIGCAILPETALAALAGSFAAQILAAAGLAGLGWQAQQVLNRFRSKKLYDDPLTTEMLMNVFIGLGSIGLSFLRAAKARGRVRGYRAVSNAELDDIAEYKGFRPDPKGRSMEDKWFSETREGAEKFSNMYPELENIVEAEVPKSVYNKAYHHPNIDNTGPGFAIQPEQLPKVKPIIE